mgnify:CR=1 FL=1
MANHCMVDICIYGKRKDTDAFIKDLCLGENGCETNKGILSNYIFDFYYRDTYTYKINSYNIYDDIVFAVFGGSCKWSINYAFDMEKLKEISKKYKILIDMYGEEPGCEFVEEHAFLDGEKIRECVGDYFCYELSNYESYEDFIREVPFADIDINEFNEMKENDEWYEYREFSNDFDNDGNLELYFEKYKDENNLEEGKNGNCIIM